MLTKQLLSVGTASSNRSASAHAAFFMQNKLDDCPSHFENAHLISPMNLHFKASGTLLHHHCRHLAFLFSACGAPSGADSSANPNE